MLTEQIFAMWDKAKAGEIDAATWKVEAIRLYFDSDLPCHLATFKIAELKTLLARMNAVTYRTKKADVVEGVYRVFASVLTVMSPLDLSYTTSYDDIRYGRAETKRLVRVRQAIEAITDEHMVSYAVERQAATAKAEEALSNPQTLQDYALFVRTRGVDALSVEQIAHYDSLIWQRDQDAVKAEQERRAKIEQVDLGDVELTVTQERHTQKDVDIWIVRISTRVDGETYKRLAEAAERLGGGWSRYSNGFLFWEKEDAETFAGVKDGDVSAGERWARSRQAREDRAADRLAQYALRKDGAAADALAQDRLTNTVRRERMAGSAETSARQDQAMAATIMSIATAQAEGRLDVLAGVRSATQITELVHLLRMAMLNAARVRNERIDGDSEIKYDAADILHAEYPWPALPLDDATRLATILKGKRGAGIGLKMLDAVIKRANKGLVRVRTKTEADTLVELLARLPGKEYWAEAMRARAVSYQRMERMGIDNLPILRHALRELLPHVVAPAQPDPIVEAERALIGVKIPGFFPTPADVVAKMLDHARIEPGMRALEPSAGRGNIVGALLDAGAKVIAVECAYTLSTILRKKYAGHIVIAEENFLEIPVVRWQATPIDRVVMNPPFENGQDMAHVQHAYQFLSDGGRLVAIMSAGTFFRDNTKTQAFRAWLDEIGGEVVEDLPAGTFYHEAGTNVATKMVLICK
jgi:predicted RNA methylase